MDLVVQLDPPTDSKVFLHRCRRAGGAGQKGLSVLLLQPGRENDLTPLGSPAIEITKDEANSKTAAIRKTVLADGTLHDKPQRNLAD